MFGVLFFLHLLCVVVLCELVVVAVEAIFEREHVRAVFVVFLVHGSQVFVVGVVVVFVDVIVDASEIRRVDLVL